jgi:hypothetical protein
MPEYAVVRLSDDDQKLYSRLFVSHDDIVFAQYCAGVLHKKGWHNEPWERRGTVYEQQAAYTTALVTAYGRPFTRSKGWPPLPKNLITSTYDEQETRLHEQIMELRHTVYAHSDSVRYTIQPWRIGRTPTTTIRRPILRITATDTTLFLTMSSKLLSSINARMESLLAKARLIPVPPQAAESSSTRAKMTIHRRRK